MEKLWKATLEWERKENVTINWERNLKASYVKIYDNKFENLEEMENFLAKYQLSTLSPKKNTWIDQ